MMMMMMMIMMIAQPNPGGNNRFCQRFVSCRLFFVSHLVFALDLEHLGHVSDVLNFDIIRHSDRQVLQNEKSLLVSTCRS